jgi:MFS family permease
MSTLTADTATQRDGTVISVVSLAHFFSHVMQFALPTLFPLLRTTFGVDYFWLGVVATCFFIASGLGQSTAGVLVDRLGAHRLLVAGLLLLALGIGLTGLATQFWMLLPLAVVAGLGNSVFHPADLSILSHRVTERRLGRAFACHGIAGALGFACSPILVSGLSHAAGWRASLVILALAVAVVALLVQSARGVLVDRAGVRKRRPEGAPRYFAIIGTPVVVLAFIYFAFTAFAGTGIQTFGVVALQSGYALASLAPVAITCYFAGSATGMVAGGFLAERTRHHHRVAMAGLIVTAAVMMGIAATSASLGYLVPSLLAIAGFSNGITAPSRDVLVRRAAAGAGMGSVFGFVYSGFDLGSSTAPLVFGSVLDHQAPHLVFVVAAIAFVVAIPTVMQVQQQSRRKLAPVVGAGPASGTAVGMDSPKAT